MPMSLKLVTAGVLAVQVFASSAAADPIRVTSGTLSFDIGDPPAFTLLTSSGQLLEAEGFHSNWAATCFYRCSPGVAIPLSITPTETTDGSMFFRADGVELFPVMQLVISAPSVTLGVDRGTLNGPFEVFDRPFMLTGHLVAFASPDRTGTPLFDLTLVGSGTARLSMSRENGRYSFSSLDYDFQAAPVPEPGTLLLMGTGAALIWRQRRGHR